MIGSKFTRKCLKVVEFSEGKIDEKQVNKFYLHFIFYFLEKNFNLEAVSMVSYSYPYCDVNIDVIKCFEEIKFSVFLLRAWQ